VIAGLRLLAGDGVRIANYPRVLVAGLCDETDPEYELRYGADEEYVRALIDRIDEMSLRGVKLCNRCAEKHPGKWEEKLGKAKCAECERNVERHLFCRKVRPWRGGRAAVSGKADEREVGPVVVHNDGRCPLTTLEVEKIRSILVCWFTWKVIRIAPGAKRIGKAVPPLAAQAIASVNTPLHCNDVK
jgi:hypothetical protein